MSQEQLIYNSNNLQKAINNFNNVREKRLEDRRKKKRRTRK